MTFRNAMTAVLIAAMLAGCAARSRTKTAKDVQPTPPYTGPVCFLPSPLPQDVKATPIGQLLASKRWYGSTTEVLQAAADEARRSGADVVAHVKTGHDINAWSWARPVANGDSYRLDDGVTIDCVKLGGTLR